MSSRKRKPPLGQHFLVSDSVIDRIVDSIQPKPADTLVEIGPGRGALTERLVDRAGMLHAIELDAGLAAQMNKKLAGDNVTIHCADAVKFDYASLCGKTGKIRIAGNLPYYISTQLILLFAKLGEIVEDVCIMVQKEVADRLTAACGSRQYGRITVSVARHMSCELLFNVSPDAFSPVPDVQSSVIHMQPRRIARPDPAITRRFDDLVRAAFSKKRKTLRNSLAGTVTAKMFEHANIDAGLRAEDLTAEQFEQLAHQFDMGS